MGKILKEMKTPKLATEWQRRGSLPILEGLNSKETEALVALDTLQEIQIGRRGCKQEWHHLSLTQKEKNMLVSKQTPA